MTVIIMVIIKVILLASKRLHLMILRASENRLEQYESDDNIVPFILILIYILIATKTKNDHQSRFELSLSTETTTDKGCIIGRNY